MFSITTSAPAASLLTISRPSALFRSTPIERLFRFTERKYADSRASPSPAKGGPQWRVSSPRWGCSTLTPSAPRSASTIVAYGPARTRERSRTLTPSSGNTAGIVPSWPQFNGANTCRATRKGSLQWYVRVHITQDRVMWDNLAARRGYGGRSDDHSTDGPHRRRTTGVRTPWRARFPEDRSPSLRGGGTDSRGRSPVRPGEDRAQHPGVVGEGDLPAGDSPGDGEPRAPRHASLRLQVRRQERRRVRARLHGAGGRRLWPEDLRLRPGLPRHVGDPQVWLRGAEAGVAPEDGPRRRDRLLRPHRAHRR